MEVKKKVPHYRVNYEGYSDDEDDYGDYDEEQEAELDRWLAGLDDGQDEDR